MSGDTFQQDVATIRGFVQRKVAAATARNESRWRQAAADAEDIIAMIKNDYRPAAIYQWGSVLDQKQFTSISDSGGLEDCGQFMMERGTQA